MDIKTLQSYLIKPHTIKQLERTLGHYERRWYGSDSTIYKTDKGSDSIKIIMPYTRMYDTVNYLSDIIYIEYDKSQIVHTIRFILEEDQVRINKLENFIKKIIAAGYRYNLAYTRITSALGGKSTYLTHPTNKATVKIYIIDNRRASISVTKS